jgi:antitoxin (DNA-binding transcriptional repressor) of toxin-antitoxin stability system
MKSVNVSVSRKRCVTLLDELPPDGNVIARRGKPIARVTRVRKNNADLIGSMAGMLEIRGDIFSTGEKWDAES